MSVCRREWWLALMFRYMWLGVRNPQDGHVSAFRFLCDGHVIAWDRGCEQNPWYAANGDEE